MPIRSRCSGHRFLSGVDQLSDAQKQLVTDFGFGGLLELGCKQLHMPLCFWLVSKVNLAYCHIQMENGQNIEMNARHVGLIFGIPHVGQKYQQLSNRNDESAVPTINEIHHLMLAAEDGDDFRRLFIIFAYATLLAPTTRLEGHHYLWHSPAKTLLSDINWGEFVLRYLLQGIHYFRKNGGTYIRGCLMFLQLFYVSFSHFPPMEVPTTTSRCAHWTYTMVKKRIKLETDILGGFGHVQLQLAFEAHAGKAHEVESKAMHDAVQNHDAPFEGDDAEAAAPLTNQHATDTTETIMARMETTGIEIEAAQTRLNLLMATYARDMNTLKKMQPIWNPQPASHGEELDERMPTPKASTFPAHSSPQAPVGHDEPGPSTAPSPLHWRGSEEPLVRDEAGSSTAPSRLHLGESEEPPVRDEADPSTIPSPLHWGRSDEHPIRDEVGPSTIPLPLHWGGSDEHPIRDEVGPSTSLSPLHCRRSEELSVPNDSVVQKDMEEAPQPNDIFTDIPSSRRKRSKKTASRRVRHRGPACRSPFVTYCISKFRKLSNHNKLIADYVFDDNRDPMEVICSFNTHGITRGQLNCLAGQGFVDFQMMSTFCYYMNAVEREGGPRYFILPQFGEIAASMAKTSQKTVIRKRLSIFIKGAA